MLKVFKFPLGSMQTNCYFLVDEGTREAAIVDPADDCPTILRKITEKDVSVKYIILTHGHFDHMLALEKLRSATGAQVCVHVFDAAALTNPDISMMRQFAGINVPCKPADIFLEEGSVLYLGESKIEVLSTPGHTPGSICLIAGTNLISGDTLFREGIGRYDFFGGSYKDITQSLKRLAALVGDYKVYPGHGAATFLSHERAFNPYMI